MTQVEPIKESLLETDATFRRLYEEHQEYKQRLEALRQKTPPSQEDEVEIKRIKLHKLSLKDRMEAILRERSGAPASA